MPARENTVRKNELQEEKARHHKKKSSRTPSRKSSGGFFRDERLWASVGAFLILLSLFAGISFASYFREHFSWGTDSRIPYTDIGQILTSSDLTVNNWGGRLGEALSWQLITQGFGIGSVLIVFFLLLTGIRLAIGKSLLPLGATLRWSMILLVWLSLVMGFFFSNGTLAILGGVFGKYGNQWLVGFLGKPGAGMVYAFVLLVMMIYAINLSLKKIMAIRLLKRAEKPEIDFKPSASVANPLKEDRYNTVEFAVDDEEKDWEYKPVAEAEEKKAPEPKEVAYVPAEPIVVKQSDVELSIEVEPAAMIPADSNGDNGVIHHGLDTPYDPTLDLATFIAPPLDLLDDIAEHGSRVNREELEANKHRIVQTLNNYGIKIEKIKATIGPAVTLYEIIPAPGVRISKIKNLEDDIALSLSAIGIRIIAPIPGRGTIGIEVPNQNPEIVSMKSILMSEKFQSDKYDLPFGMGKTISNESYVADLTKMPHILMAGATGQGKSVGLNAILTSLLYKKHPSQVKFVLIDPKKVELTLFSKIERHFLAKLPDSEEAIITDTRMVVRTLNSLNILMDSRYDLLKLAQVRNIKEYNTKFIARQLNPNDKHEFLPYIVVVIDEFADLIMTAGKEIEIPLTRLAQLARATGIHLVIATQRPSVNIITGSIKANFPARFAFRVISKIDSRTILDSSGAEQLIGRGDLLLSTGSDLLRLQCAFIDTHEIERITDFIGSQRGYTDAYHLPEYHEDEADAGDFIEPGERDELFEDAARIIVAHQQGSTSLLQRKLKLGYNRAGRLIDQLEQAGIVGPFEGSKAREVKISTEFALEQFLRDLNLKHH